MPFLEYGKVMFNVDKKTRRNAFLLHFLCLQLKRNNYVVIPVAAGLLELRPVDRPQYTVLF